MHPGLATLPGARRVLVLGGGDGLALREILKYPQIESVTLVDLDPAMTRLFSSAAQLRKLNEDALISPKVKVVNADAQGTALQQIKNRGYADKYRARGEPIHLIGVEFSKDSRNIVGFEVETCGAILQN